MAVKQPTLNRFYQQYLADEKSADFVRTVTRTYSIATLHRLAFGGDKITRRAATLALTLVAGRESFHVIGRALRDEDRAVRLLASDGIHSVWSRSHGIHAEQQLNKVSRLLMAGRAETAIQWIDRLLEDYPTFAEAWNKRSIALFDLERIYEAVTDCERVLELNPYHFAAATGLGHCYLDLEEPAVAIKHFQYALSINPDLEYVRSQIDQLQRSNDF